jgi:hypothetical protein
MEGATARRLKQASDTKARVAGQELQLEMGEQVDMWRQPDAADVADWRGLGGVADLSALDEGVVGVRWQGWTLPCRTQDVRKRTFCLAYLQMCAADLDLLRLLAASLAKSCACVGWRNDSKGWTLSKKANEHPADYQAAIHTARGSYRVPWSLDRRRTPYVTRVSWND